MARKRQSRTCWIYRGTRYFRRTDINWCNEQRSMESRRRLQYEEIQFKWLCHVYSWKRGAGVEIVAKAIRFDVQRGIEGCVVLGLWKGRDKAYIYKEASKQSSREIKHANYSKAGELPDAWLGCLKVAIKVEVECMRELKMPKTSCWYLHSAGDCPEQNVQKPQT